MNKVIIIFIFIILAVTNQPALAVSKDNETYTVEVPAVIKSYFKGPPSEPAIGFVEESVDYLPPNSTDSEGFITIAKNSIFTTSGGFSRLVKGSYTGDYWELTTLRPIGVIVSYNTSGTIAASFDSLTGNSTITRRIYPSSVAFGVGSGAGIEGRIFKFYPIVGVYKNTQAGNYSGTITITVPNL